jgi:glucokinase
MVGVVNPRERARFDRKVTLRKEDFLSMERAVENLVEARGTITHDDAVHISTGPMRSDRLHIELCALSKHEHLTKSQMAN